MKVHWVLEHIIKVDQISNMNFLHKTYSFALFYNKNTYTLYTTFTQSFHFINYMCEMPKNLNYDQYFFLLTAGIGQILHNRNINSILTHLN